MTQRYNFNVLEGSTISHYKVLEKLGSGGMGDVWKAEDTKLHRDIALKLLASHLLRDEEARKRFHREAQAAASLSHPNVTTIYEIDEADDKTFLALEYIEGETLERRIESGPLPLQDALDIGRQIAEGLEAAHCKGVVHRDIKPGNVLITPDGRVKILDFGLALLTEGSKLTQLDTTVGTVAYMSPEQTQAAEVDHRSDIWALGCIVYEMVCGQRPFQGTYDQAVMYSILNEAYEPITGIRAGLPMELEFIVGKCLEKDAKDRYDSASDNAKDLRSLGEKLKSGRSAIVKSAAVDVGPTESSSVRQAEPGDPVLRRKLHLALAVATAATMAFAALAFMHFGEAPIEQPVSKWSFAPALEIGGAPVAVSPNGRHIAYLAGPGERRLWVRDVDRLEPRELAGTEGAIRPFWSPDSRLIGFAAGGEVKKISVQGGPAITLCPVRGVNFVGGSWSPDGESIAFTIPLPDGMRVFEVPARGGPSKLLFEPEEDARGAGYGAFPHFLPAEAGARSVLLRVGARRDPEHDVVLKNLETGESLLLAKGGRAVYSPSGHIVYEGQGGLWALPFSLDVLKPTGEAFPIAENRGVPSVAMDGKLVSVGGPLRTDTSLDQLVWRDRTGEKVGEIGQPQTVIRYPALSPDGRSVAVASDESGNVDVWVHEVERPSTLRLTFDDAPDGQPHWSPSRREITFTSGRGGTNDIFRRPADGTGEAELLVGKEANERPWGWSRDGNYLVYTSEAEENSDLWYLKRRDDGQGFESMEFLATPFNETAPSLSPGGDLLAYCSNLSGQEQVYVRPFPSGDGQWAVSTNGGYEPRWSRDGKELFYVEDDTLMAVEVTTTPVFSAGVTTPLFSNPHLSDRGRMGDHAVYDVSEDGRFVMPDSAAIEGANEEPPDIQVVENWYEEFRDRE